MLNLKNLLLFSILIFSDFAFGGTLVYENNVYQIDTDIILESLQNSNISDDTVERIKVTGTRIDLNFDYSYTPSSIELNFRGERENGNTRSDYHYSDREKDALKQRCLMKGEIGFNKCMAIVGTGSAVGGALAAACGPLIAACVAVVALETVAGTYVCADAHTKHKFACTRI